MNVQHIKIPFDELDLHKHQEKNEIFLAETLLYSTKVNLHFGKNKFICILVVTKYHVWFKNQKNQNNIFSLPFQALICLLKCSQHPEIVFVTDKKFDNIRISASTQNRCNGIISSISYVFTIIFKIPQLLNVYFINSADLSYFQRRIQEKEKSSQINLNRYKKMQCKYQQKFSGIGDIFGEQFVQKIILIKQIYSQNDHMIHIAQVNQKQLYYLHTISKDEQKIKNLRNHVNIQNTQQLIYARALEYKIQLFFQYIPQLHQQKQLWCLYDELLLKNSQAVLTLSMLCYNENQKIIKLREVRYNFLLIQNNLNKLIYECYFQKNSQFNICISKRDLKSKIYHICLILYQYIFGKVLFFHEQVQMIIELKKKKKIEFPEYLKIKIDKSLKTFLSKGIQFDYEKPENFLVQNEWIKKNNIKFSF